MSTACNTSLVLLKLLSHVISLPSYALFTERIDNKLLSLTYKVLTTTQPPYLHNLISTQRPRSTRSSSVVILARPPSSSSLKITDRSFRHASPCLWNQLALSLRKPHSGTSSSISCSPIPSLITSSSSDSPLCTSITPSLFHSRLKTYLFHKSYPRCFTSSSRTASTNFCLDRFFWATRFLILFFPYFSFLGRAIDWAGHLVSFWAHVNLPYRIVSYAQVVTTRTRKAFSRAHTSPLTLTFDLPKFNHLVPCGQGYDWRSLVTTGLDARKLLTNIYLNIYLHTNASENITSHHLRWGSNSNKCTSKYFRDKNNRTRSSASWSVERSLDAREKRLLPVLYTAASIAVVVWLDDDINDDDDVTAAEVWYDTHMPSVQRYKGGVVVTRWSRSTRLTYAEPGQYSDGWSCPGSTPGGGTLVRYVTSHPGRLSILPSMGTSQRAVMLWLGR